MKDQKKKRYVDNATRLECFRCGEINHPVIMVGDKFNHEQSGSILCKECGTAIKYNYRISVDYNLSLIENIIEAEEVFAKA